MLYLLWPIYKHGVFSISVTKQGSLEICLGSNLQLFLPDSISIHCEEIFDLVINKVSCTWWDKRDFKFWNNMSSTWIFLKTDEWD